MGLIKIREFCKRRIIKELICEMRSSWSSIKVKKWREKNMKQPLQKLDLKKCLGLDRAKREIEIEISSKILDDRVVSLRSKES